MTIAFRPLSRADFGLVHTWLHAPHVLAWWREPLSPREIEAEYGPCVDGDDPTRVFIIEEDQRAIGLIQCYRIADDPEWDRAMGVPAAAGIDYLIGDPADCGRGLGTEVIRIFGQTVFARYADAAVIAVAVQQDNAASCRALARAGYELLDVRELESGHPSDAGPSAIYALRRNQVP